MELAHNKQAYYIGGMQNLPPAKNLGLLIHDVGRLMRRELDQRAQAIGLTSAQWRVLAYLARCEGTNQVSLADLMDMEPITLSRHLDRMEADGLTERRRDPSDRRAHRLYLTEAGRELMASFRGVSTGVMREAIDGISDADIEKVTQVLLRMRGNLTGKAGADAPRLLSKIAEQKDAVA
jgi:DNA-binding MarR family transcriptional regulator